MSCQNKNQTEVFLESEADGWFERNFKDSTKKEQEKDMALNFLLSMDLSNKSVLEVGCADGWRLERLKNNGCDSCYGVDPSIKAIEAGRLRFPELKLSVGTASNLEISKDQFDVVVAGFCLYLCDREELFKVAYELDRVLKDGGILVITDFFSNFPYQNKYEHYEGLFSYKMDYSKLFLWNPIYTIAYQKNVDMSNLSIISDNPDNKITLTVIRKRLKDSYPSEPYVR